MKSLLVAALCSVAVSAFAQDVEGITQTDRVCIGRRMIVQTMNYRKSHGETEQQYLVREVEPYKGKWSPRQIQEVTAAVHYVWNHTSEENSDFAGAVMEACYKSNQGA